MLGNILQYFENGLTAILPLILKWGNHHKSLIIYHRFVLCEWIHGPKLCILRAACLRPLFQRTNKNSASFLHFLYSMSPILILSEWSIICNFDGLYLSPVGLLYYYFKLSIYFSYFVYLHICYITFSHGE